MDTDIPIQAAKSLFDKGKLFLKAGIIFVMAFFSLDTHKSDKGSNQGKSRSSERSHRRSEQQMGGTANRYRANPYDPL